MARYDVAHVRERGVAFIIVPLDASFGHRTAAEQDGTIAYLQFCAESAGLPGTVVPVWEIGGGGMGFLAPPEYHPFFRSISLGEVAANINRYLECD